MITIDLPSFFILTEKGESMLPESFDLAHVKSRERILYLDANICLNAIHYFDNKPLLDKALINVETLILYCQQSKIEVIPKFGAMELCNFSFE